MITIEQLQNQLQSVKASLKSGGVSSTLQTELISNQDLLQGWIDRLALGSLSSQDIQDMQQSLDDSRKRTLDAQVRRTKRMMIFVGIGVISIVGGIVFYYYKKRKK